MGHILLVILKFIGILLASILALFFFLVLLVLLAPFGYAARGEAGGKQTFFQGKLSWLFAVILCKVVYSENGLHWYIRIFGYTVAGNSEKFQQRKAKRLEKKKKKAKKLPKAKNEKESKAKPEPKTEPEIESRAKPEAKTEPGIESGTKPEAKTEPGIESRTKPEQKKELESSTLKKPDPQPVIPKNLQDISEHTGKQSFGDKVKKVWQKLTGFFINGKKKLLAIPDKLRHIRDNLEKKKEKLEKIYTFWKNEATQDAKNCLIREGKKVLLHILPRKFRGEVEFGLEDPYVMGQILAVLGMLMPLYQNKLVVHPDFEEQKFAGRFSLKGRVIPGYLVWKGLVLLLNKNIRKTIKEGKQLIGGN